MAQVAFKRAGDDNWHIWTCPTSGRIEFGSEEANRKCRWILKSLCFGIVETKAFEHGEEYTHWRLENNRPIQLSGPTLPDPF